MRDSFLHKENHLNISISSSIANNKVPTINSKTKKITLKHASTRTGIRFLSQFASYASKRPLKWNKIPALKTRTT